MTSLPFVTRMGMVTALIAAITLLPTPQALGQSIISYYPDMDGGAKEPEGEATPSREKHVLNMPLFAPLFVTRDDAQAFWDLSANAYAAPAPSARKVAKAFLRDHLSVDGDAYVVAHFASAESRRQGKPDHVLTLTDALMQAFPEHSRHSFFAELADGVGGINGGGNESPGVLTFVESLVHGRHVSDVFKKVGAFLWSRTGPGYVYNTFFAKGNVIESVVEDRRPLDEAFGIYAAGGEFTAARASTLRLSQLIERFEQPGTFAELPYVKALNRELDTYWEAARTAWPLVARYQFVHEARKAHATGVLGQEPFARVMRAGAPHVPLDGPITLAQLRLAATAGSGVRRFDINGYAASDIVRFTMPDGSEIMYIPGGDRPFVAFGNEAALRQWVVAQATNPRALDALLLHFSTYNRQDGVFSTGVGHALEKLGNGQWNVDQRSVDHANTAIGGDLFQDMQAQTEKRMREDARMQVSTAWEGWRTTINRTTTLLAPLGYVPALALPVQLGSALAGIGTGVEQGIDGRTLEERRAGFGQALMTVVTTVPLGAAFSSLGVEDGTGSSAQSDGVAGSKGGSPSFVLPQRVNGRIGYPLSPLKAVRWTKGEGNPRAGNDVQPGPSQLDPLADSESRPPLVFADAALELENAGYIVAVVPDSVAARTTKIIDLKKSEIDGLRHRLDDFRWNENGERIRNEAGYYAANHSIVYRVDARMPQDLLAQGRFGPSPRFNALYPMVQGDATIGSGSLGASNVVFETWNREGYANRHHFNQYAVWTEGREVVSASDNLSPEQHETRLDEVHFPADIPAKDIYIVDSDDPAIQKAIAEIIESKHVSTPYGVPLEAFVEYVDGRLDVHAPNEFSEGHLEASPPMSGVPSSPL